MVSLVYILIAVLVVFVITYVSSEPRCPDVDYRYLGDTPVDLYTHDDRSCEAEEPEETAVEVDTVSDEEQEEIVDEEVSVAEVVEETVVEAEVPDSDTPTDDGATTAQKPSLLLDAPRDGQKENLTRIKGVGPVIEKKLNGMGIYHFDQIASLTQDDIAMIDAQLSFTGRIEREDWIGQSVLLAKGKETEFSKRVDNGDVSSSIKS